MVSDSLQSIYQQYKRDTEVIASWLATTAKAHGYTNPLGPQAAAAAPAATKPSTRLKGKARKKAKKATPAPAAPTNQNWKTMDYTLAIRDFVPLAEHIAAIKHGAVRIPEYFSVALERVIWVRGSFSEMLEKAGKILDMQSDGRHTFFVKVLENVRKVLNPLLSTDAFNVSDLKNAVPKAAGSTTRPKNMFEVLTVYEPSAAFENAPDIQLPKPSDTEYMVEEDDSPFGLYFCMSMLMRDLSRIRGEIADLWTTYEKGNMDLAAVSAAVYTAIELARSFEEDIKPILQREGGTSVVHVLYFQDIAYAAGIYHHSRERYDDDYNFAAYDIADCLFYNTLINLIVFFLDVGADTTTKSQAIIGLYGWYDEDSTEVPKTGRQRYVKDKMALIDMLLHLTVMAGYPSPVEDHLVRGMREARKHMREDGTPEIPIWFSFAAQIYLDTLNNVTIASGWNDMQAYIRTVRPIVNAHPLVSARASTGKSLWKNLDIINILLNRDPIVNTCLVPDKPKPKNHTFYRRHPLYCGLWINAVRVLFHEAGLAYVASQCTVLHTTQLYQALHQEKLIDAKWVELEAMWKAQGNATYFIGDPPTTAEGYLKNYRMTMGMSAANFVPNKHKRGITLTKATIRKMMFKGLTSHLLALRTRSNGDHRVLNPETVQDWIIEGAKGRTHHDVQPAAQSSQSLIYNLATAIQAEIPDLEFNYFALQDDCKSLLSEIRDGIESLGPWSMLPEDGHNGLHSVIDVTFSDAAWKSNVDEGPKPTRRLLEYVGRVLCEWLKRR